MDRAEPTSSIEATVPNDFAHLSNEIIHDVVDSHGAERRSIYEKLETLVEIDGSWGEFARELSACTVQHYGGINYASVLFCSRVFDRVAGKFCKKNISHEDALNRFICSSIINNEFDFDLLLTVASKLYDVVNICTVPDTYCKALNLMGNRFSSVFWRGKDPNEAATPELVTFLRRHLLSNCLRKLEVYDVKFEDGAFDEQMEVFVKRPSFEYLSMGPGPYPVPFQVFKEAHKTWLAPEAVDFKNRALCVYSSKQTVEKLENYFETNVKLDDGTSSPFIMKHPEQSTAEMCIKVFNMTDYHKIYMSFHGAGQLGAADSAPSLLYRGDPDTEQSDELTDSGSDCDSGSNSEYCS